MEDHFRCCDKVVMNSLQNCLYSEYKWLPFEHLACVLYVDYNSWTEGIVHHFSMIQEQLLPWPGVPLGLGDLQKYRGV